MSQPLMPFLRLMRISNLPTAWSNVLVGFLIVNQSWQPATALFVLLASSSCMYLAGMVLNDVFDFEFDKRVQPQRILPSGQVPVKTARGLGFVLWVGSLLLASLFLSGRMMPELPLGGALPLITMACLGSCVLAYDMGLKNTALGPVVMGSCRFFNVLFGGSLVATSQSTLFGYDPFCIGVALGIGIYVAGITWFAKKEHVTSHRWGLMGGGWLMAVGIGWLVWLANSSIDISTAPSEIGSRDSNVPFVFSGLLLMMFFPVIRRALAAVFAPNPENVKRAVVVSLLTLIMIDAAMCYFVVPSNLFYCCVTASLIVPAYLLSRLISAT